MKKKKEDANHETESDFRNCILLLLPCFQRFKVNFTVKERRFVLMVFSY